jgi:hypothetical protein
MSSHSLDLISSQAVQALMVLYGLFMHLGTPSNVRKERRCLILVSWAILVTSSTDVLMDLWGSYQTLYSGGPTGASYINAFSDYQVSSRNLLRASNVMLILTIAVGDSLMVRRIAKSLINSRLISSSTALALLRFVQGPEGRRCPPNPCMHWLHGFVSSLPSNERNQLITHC